ncbi:uncharacterized protein LOC113511134 [Galleria mellonella]|uniref:Uncharacterized protein LOC113511134 n=1 Tax=Galleria mellonella TaxID=7137 RepID=A0ABM3MY72_GALME|nr:uncharacterized protein LOC113511134 [Galleria mellonella]
MGKLPYLYTESDETDDTNSSTDNNKKKKKFSIFKCVNGNVKKRKCKLHSKSERDDSDSRSGSRSNQRVRYKLPGILKKDKERERDSSEGDDDYEYPKPHCSQDRCLVGRVPRPPGAKPGRGGGVAIIVKKNISELQPQQSTSSTKRYHMKRLRRKRSC